VTAVAGFPDVDDAVWGQPHLPAWLKEFRPHQQQAIMDVLDRFSEGCDVVMLSAPTGCLAGDTSIGTNRGGNGRSYPLSELVALQNGAGQQRRSRNARLTLQEIEEIKQAREEGLTFTRIGTKFGISPQYANSICLGKKRQPVTGRRDTSAWATDIQTFIQTSDGSSMRLGLLKRAVDSGQKVTYELLTEGGRGIRATADHRFMTPDGWAQLKELSPGDKVQVLEGQGGKAKGIKSQYRYTSHLIGHPFAKMRDPRHWSKSGYRVLTHRLVVEADLNGLSFETFVSRLRSGDAKSLKFLDPELWHVHHRNGNTFDNAVRNLEVLSTKEHHRRHALEGRWRAVNFHIGLDVIESISHFGVEPTFDLMMGEPHNFIANGLVVHNSGKSALGDAVRRLLDIPKALYVCTTLQLQSQLARDFSYGVLLRGRSNYATYDHPEWAKDRFNPITCADCRLENVVLPACDNCVDDSGDNLALHCSWCHPPSDDLSPVDVCPYQQAKQRAFAARFAITNTAYFITEANGPGMFSARPFVIIDEADTLESQLLAHNSVHISERRKKLLELEPPPYKTVEESWLPWIDAEAIPKVNDALHAIASPAKTLSDIREFSFYARLLGQLENMKVLLKNGNAVYDGYQRGDITFSPIRVDQDAKDLLWRHGKKWLLMSATLIPDEMEQSLGIEAAGLKWGVVNVPSTFPVENRRVIVRNAANMTKANKDVEWPKMVDIVKKVLARYPDDRTLIHTVSYDLTSYLFENLRDCGRPLVVYGSAKEREEALRIYSETPGAVLLAPSMDRGVDLKEDLCFIPGTLIRTSNGYKSIEEIRVGDRVWTHRNRYRRVTQVHQRDFTGELVGLKTYMGPEQFLTPNHPVLISHWGHNRWGGKSQITHAKRDWRLAGELTEDDLPLLAVGHQSRAYKPLGKLYKSGNLKTGRLVPNKWDDTPDFWYLVGLWAAEGSLERRVGRPNREGRRSRVHWGVVWSFGSDEATTLAKECCDLVETVLGNKRPNPYVWGSGARVVIKNTAFALWLQKNVGRSAEAKVVPTRLLRHRDIACRRAFLDGYWAGDGNHKEKGWQEASTASMHLALGVRDLALDLGFTAGYNSYYNKTVGRNYWYIHWTSSPRGACRTQRDVLSRNNSLRRVPYSGPVHNLSVEGDESFSTSSFTVHNCRVVILTKVPWPSLGDKRVAKRLYSPGGKFWYRSQAARSIVQAMGRASRHDKDFSVGFILDSQFASNLYKTRELFPSWFREAVDMSGGDL
jgi:hypothetical protein